MAKSFSLHLLIAQPPRNTSSVNAIAMKYKPTNRLASLPKQKTNLNIVLWTWHRFVDVYKLTNHHLWTFFLTKNLLRIFSNIRPARDSQPPFSFSSFVAVLPILLDQYGDPPGFCTRSGHLCHWPPLLWAKKLCKKDALQTFQGKTECSSTSKLGGNIPSVCSMQWVFMDGSYQKPEGPTYIVWVLWLG